MSWRLTSLLAALLLAAVACGGNGEPSPDVGATGDETADGAEEEALPEVCEGQDGSGLKIGVTTTADTQEFAVTVREGIEDVAAECNLDTIAADNELDPQKVIENMRNFAAQDVDGAVIFNAQRDVADAVCDTLGDRPSIAIDIPHPCSVFVGQDNRSAGELGGERVGEFVKERWDCDVDQIVTFEAFAVGQVNVDRMNGQIAGLQKVCPDLEYGSFEDWSDSHPDSIITRHDGITLDESLEDGRSYLAAHPDADHIVSFSLNSDANLGFVSAVQQAGREGQVIYGSMGESQSVFEEICANENYAGVTAFFPDKYGEIIVPAILRMIDGEEVEGPLYIDNVFLSADNIAEHYPERACS